MTIGIYSSFIFGLLAGIVIGFILVIVFLAIETGRSKTIEHNKIMRERERAAEHQKSNNEQEK